jgi:hypothetical protein
LSVFLQLLSKLGQKNQYFCNFSPNAAQRPVDLYLIYSSTIF